MEVTDLDLTNNIPDFSFFLQVGDIVNHIKEPDYITGKIIKIDWNLIHCGYGSTTCLVLWNDCEKPEIAWTNKLMKAA